MPLSREVGLDPSNTVLDGELAPPSQKRGQSPPPNFRPMYIVNQDATCYGGRPRPRRRCVRWGPNSPLKGAQPPIFGLCLLWPSGWMDEDTSWYRGRPRPRRHSVRWVPAPPKRGTASNFRPTCIVAKKLWPIFATACCCYMSGNRNECPLQIRYLLVCFTCDVNMTSLSLLWHRWAATASAAYVSRLGAVADWWRS